MIAASVLCLLTSPTLAADDPEVAPKGAAVTVLKAAKSCFANIVEVSGTIIAREEMQVRPERMGLKVAVVGGMTAFDEAVLRNMGDEALGIITSCWYSADVENAINKRFVANFRVDWGYDPGFYAAATYVEAAVLDATLQRIHGKIEDKQAFMKTVRAITVDTARGPVRFDHLGNVVGNVYIRRVERKDGRLVNSVIHTYPNVSQFWTYKEAEFLKNPVYSRDWPPAKNLES